MHPSISRLWLAFAESDHALGGLPRDPISVFHFCDTPTDANLCAELVRYQAAFKVLVSKVDTNERHAVPWPDWAVSARIDAGAHREGVWRAVQQHETQIAIYGTLSELTPEQHREIWGGQTFYRVLSHVNGGRQLETDLFAGIKSPATHRDPETADGHYPAR